MFEEHHSTEAFLLSGWESLKTDNRAAANFIRASMDYWVQHPNECSSRNRFHGWDPSQYNGNYCGCLVFPYKSDALRLYGFLCNPTGDRRQLFVPVKLIEKRAWRTDETVLRFVKKLSEDPQVNSLCRKILDEERKETD